MIYYSIKQGVMSSSGNVSTLRKAITIAHQIKNDTDEYEHYEVIDVLYNDKEVEGL